MSEFNVNDNYDWYRYNNYTRAWIIPSVPTTPPSVSPEWTTRTTPLKDYYNEIKALWTKPKLQHDDLELKPTTNNTNEKETNNMTEFMNGMFGKVAPGMCRITMKGNIAIKTSNGDYKYYNVKTGRLTNCSNFVFDIGQDFFFVVPTTKVAIGDVILVNKKPKCVIEIAKNKITVVNYDDSTVETILPERHIFMGSVYFYGKIVSMFGKSLTSKKGPNSIFKYMMMSEMMKGNNGSNNFGNMLPMMMFMNGGSSFDDMFDFDFEGEVLTDEDEKAEDETESEEEE